MEYTINFLLAQFHNGAWYAWRKVDDDGNTIPNDQRMKLENAILTDFGTAQGYSIPNQSQLDAKEQELKDADIAKVNKKASGKQKLKNLGLDDEEIKALTGA
tara:strand:- start:1012 stop:1317 length:306 start_codon:yes stop_codon:yes gene_type:complete